jgi:tellurite resistance protein TehA-like permease
MKKVTIYVLAAAVFCYLAVAFATLHLNPLKWDAGVRIAFVMFSPVVVGLVYSYPRDKK